MHDQIRLDRGDMLRFDDTPEGYLRGEAVVSRTGVFPYVNADGSIRRELRHPDDILTQATLDSIKQIPVTLDHPTELVSADNAKALTIGHVGDNVRIDGPNIIAGFTVTDADAIRQIRSGKRGLSLGYVVSDLKREDGVYNGQTYTHRQIGTIVNHLAVCVAGRVGPSARINLDGASVQIETTTQERRNMANDVKLVSVNLDGLDYQAAPEIAKALTKETARADAAEADVEKTRAEMQAEIDKMQAQLDAAEKDAEKRSDDAINAIVADRVALLADAAKYVKDTAELVGKSAREIQEAVIATKYDDMDLKERSDDYVQALFDTVKADARKDKAHEQVKTATEKRGDSAKRTDADDAFEAIKAQSRKKEDKK